MPINTAAVHTDIFKKFRTFRKSAVISVSALALALAGGAANSQEAAKPAKATASPTKNKVRKASTTSADELPTITVTDKAGGGDVNAGQNDKGFVAEGTSSATFTNTPLSEIPKSVQIVTKDLIKSQQARSVVEALRNVSGVDTNSNGVLLLRGFTTKVQTNGVASNDNDGLSLGTVRPMAGISRIEVLKGADALIGGKMQPGGTVNVVLKRPQKDPLREFTIEGGSFGHLRSGFDMTGPLTDDKNLTYRMILSGERDRENFGGYDGTDGGYFAPSLGWSDAGTDLVVGAELYKLRAPVVPWTFVGPDGPFSRSGLIGNRQEGSDVQGGHAYADIQHEFEGGLVFHGKADYQNDKANTTGYGFSIDKPTATPAYFPYSGVVANKRWSLDGNLTGEVSTGPLEHEITLGGRYAKGQSNTQSYAGMPSALTDTDLPAISEGSLFPAPPRSIESSDSALFVQDHIKWDKFGFLPSITRNITTSNGNKYSAWTPNLGVTVQLTEDIAVYSSWQNSFTPQIGSFRLPYHYKGTVPPLKGTTWEGGIKLNLLDERLFVTCALFRTELRGGLIPDYRGPDPYLMRVDDGKEIRQGFEFDLNGEIAAGWNVSANYSFTKTNYNVPDDAFLRELSAHRGGAWVNYDVRDGSWQGLGAAVGVTARSGTQTFEKYPLPAQAGVDANIHWKNEKASLTLGVKNLLNSQLLSTNYNKDTANLEPARTILLTGTVQF
jgi:iron complex outermembrane receptor protein